MHSLKQSIVQDLSGDLVAFDFQLRTRLIYGAGMIERIGELTRELNCKKVLLVSDAGIVAAGHADRVRAILDAAGIASVLFDKVRENPTTKDVETCLEAARAAGIDGFIGLGGGSSMDTAKGCNFLLTNGGKMQDYWGVGKATKSMLPFIAIPTTAGTGSECQCAALIADEQTHQKMACLDKKAAARVALLDPTLTLSQPKRVAACTGIDAITHAVESTVTLKCNPMSVLYAQEALKLSAKSFPHIFKTPNDLEARGRMQLAAAFAGVAIENSMLGAAHAAANPLTAHYGIIHGQAVGIMLPHVVRFNARDKQTAEKYRALAVAAEIAADSNSTDEAVAGLLKFITGCLEVAELPHTLSQCGVEASKISVLANEAAQQWTGTFNPRKITSADFAQLYQAAL